MDSRQFHAQRFGDTAPAVRKLNFLLVRTSRWKVNGWLVKSGFDPFPEVVEVRMYIRPANDDGRFDEAMIQRIPANPDPEGAIMYNEDDG